MDRKGADYYGDEDSLATASELPERLFLMRANLRGLRERYDRHGTSRP
ncbi:MAG TPA: hypothetical protein VFU48_07130 [Nitrospira sp.]|nr:hypothetical protein [Nitrospira sp.]